MAFEVYHQPCLKLSRYSIALNKAARESLGLVDGTCLELAYDSDQKVIRIALAGTLELRKTQVFAKSFLNHFGIAAEGVYPVEVRDGALYAKVITPIKD